jgi:hypothetical protein
MPVIREGMERVGRSQSLTALWLTRPGLALTVGLVMATPPLVRALLEALSLR